MGSSQTVSVSDFGGAISAALRDYTVEVQQKIAKAVDDTAKETRDILKTTSPVATPDVHGYAKGWKVRYNFKDNRANAIIHAGENYRLVHLLEKGHAKRGGGRVAGIPHVSLAEGWAVQQLMNRIEDAVRSAR